MRSEFSLKANLNFIVSTEAEEMENQGSCEMLQLYIPANHKLCQSQYLHVVKLFCWLRFSSPLLKMYTSHCTPWRFLLCTTNKSDCIHVLKPSNYYYYLWFSTLKNCAESHKNSQTLHIVTAYCGIFNSNKNKKCYKILS